MAKAFLTPLLLSAQASTPSAPTSGFTLYANSSGAISWIGTNGYLRTLDDTQITANRIYTLPNANGTLAISRVVRADASAYTTIYVGRAAVGTAEASTGWTVIRTTYSALGVLVSTGTAAGAWSNRAALTYN